MTPICFRSTTPTPHFVVSPNRKKEVLILAVISTEQAHKNYEWF
jgi:hypothetical protein